MAFLGEQPLEEATQARVVLDDEHVHVAVLRALSEEFLKAAALHVLLLAQRAVQRTKGLRIATVLAIGERFRGGAIILLALSEQPGERTSRALAQRAPRLNRPSAYGPDLGNLARCPVYARTPCLDPWQGAERPPAT